MDDGGRDIPDIEDPKESDEGFENAKREQYRFTKEDLENETRILDHSRSEGIKNAVHSVAVVLIASAGIVLLLMMASWTYHVLTPESWHYLSPRQFEELKNMLFSASMALVVSEYAKKMLF